MNSSVEICRLERPSASRCSTSTSRGDSTGPPPRIRRSRPLTAAGPSTDSPRAAARTPGSRPSAAVSLPRKPVAPASIAANTSWSVPYALRTRTAGAGSSATRLRIRSMPWNSPAPRCMSSRTTSGRSSAGSSAISRSAVSSPSASATTRRSGCPASIARTPSRMAGWSSTTMTATGRAGAVRRDRAASRTARPPSRPHAAHRGRTPHHGHDAPTEEDRRRPRRSGEDRRGPSGSWSGDPPPAPPTIGQEGGPHDRNVRFRLG